ncbi:MAG: hypothetical protein Q9171_005403 [Xanthocarpia ochracea]
MPRNGAIGSMQTGMANLAVGDSRSARSNTPQRASEKKVDARAHREDDGWQTVSRQQSEKKPLQGIKGNRQKTVSFIEPSKPLRSSGQHSAAAPPRISAYDRRTHLPSKDPNGGSKYPKRFFKAGMIIRAILHEQNFAPTSSSRTEVTDKSYWDSPHGRICTKYRKMIVLAMYADHYTAIPIYTHNGKGLIEKEDPDEFVSIVDNREQHPGPALSRHPPLKTNQMNGEAKLLHIKSTAHITYPLSRKYDLPIVYEGNLHEGSLALLVKLVSDATPRCLRDKNGVVVEHLPEKMANTRGKR